MARATLRRTLSPTRLRAFLVLLLFALSVPSGVLMLQAWHQLQWESVAQYRVQADELAARIDTALQRALAVEEAHGYADYGFLVVAGDPTTSQLLERSPLARYPVQSELPGVIGYFQIDAEGRYDTPLLPAAGVDPATLGLDAGELAARNALAQRLLDVLARNRLTERERPHDARLAQRGAAHKALADGMAAATVESDRVAAVELGADKKSDDAQAAFDLLKSAPEGKSKSPVQNKLGRIEELRLDQRYQRNEPKQDAAASGYEQQLSNAAPRAARKEQAAAPGLELAERALAAGELRRRVQTFESELDPFEFSLLASGEGVLYRKAWRDGRRTIQGALIDREAFLQGAVLQPIAGTALAQASELVVAYQGDVLQRVPPAGAPEAPMGGSLLQQVRLSAPFDGFQLLWSVQRLPPGPGARVIAWSGAVLVFLLLAGFLLLERLGLRQIRLARQQQDFVSAVSHELNTPLTSIRMYAELLQAGWADEARKREYYDYIHGESERLSRLIANVLQLARMERDDLRLELKPIAAGTLADVLRSKLASQVERAGFALAHAVSPDVADRELAVDLDACIQIGINLVDNALKFSARAERREIEIAMTLRGSDALVWSVRDYGPGVPVDQMKRIFELFYRPGSELTRETLGTGIGLALVRQLARAMGGEVEVSNREPGAEFRLVLPLRTR